MVEKILATIVIILLLFCGCLFNKENITDIEFTPIVLYEVPTKDVTVDVTKEALNNLIRIWSIDIMEYIKREHNQITKRVPFIDMRKKKESH